MNNNNIPNEQDDVLERRATLQAQLMIFKGPDTRPLSIQIRRLDDDSYRAYIRYQTEVLAESRAFGQASTFEELAKMIETDLKEIGWWGCWK